MIFGLQRNVIFSANGRGGIFTKLNVDPKSAFVTTKAVIPSMVEQEVESLILPVAWGKISPYKISHGTAKGGLDSFSSYIAQKFGRRQSLGFSL